MVEVSHSNEKELTINLQFSWWKLEFISIIHQIRKQSWLELFDWDCIDWGLGKSYKSNQDKHPHGKGTGLAFTRQLLFIGALI